MSPKRGTGDNAVAENFFATIKGEFLDHETLETGAERLLRSPTTFDGFYNAHRLHSSNGNPARSSSS
jgi:transposase InsO family protein